MDSLKKIHSAQAAYAAECGRGFFSTSLMDLSTRPPGKSEGYLSPNTGELGRTLMPQIKGYVFTIRSRNDARPGPNDCNDFPTESKYYAIAVPVLQGITGDRTFATDQDGVIWVKEGLPPPLGPAAVPR